MSESSGVYLLPEQIIEATEYAAKQDTANKEALYNAWRILLPTPGTQPKQNASGTTSYYGWEINVRMADGTRKWVPAKYKILNLTANSAAKDNFNKCQIMFRVGSTFKMVKGEQRFGDAMFLDNAAFKYHVTKAMAEDKMGGDKVVEFIQSILGAKTTNKKRLAKADQMIRVEIEFPQPDQPEKAASAKGAARGKNTSQPPPQRQPPSPDAVSSLPIHDVSKPLLDKSGNVIPGKWHIAKLPTGGPLTYSTIGSFITSGSAISGIIDCSGIIVSSMGVSKPPKFQMIMVKHVKSARIIDTSEFGDEMAEIEGGGDEFTGESEPEPSAAAAPGKTTEPPISNDDLGLGTPDAAYDDDELEGGEGEEEYGEDEPETIPPPKAVPKSAPKAAAKASPKAK